LQIASLAISGIHKHIHISNIIIPIDVQNKITATKEFFGVLFRYKITTNSASIKVMVKKVLLQVISIQYYSNKYSNMKLIRYLITKFIIHMILVVIILCIVSFSYIVARRPLSIFLWVSFTLALTYYNPNHIQRFLDISGYHFSYETNWGSTFKNKNPDVFKAKNIKHLQDYLSSTSNPVRVTGSMHSYSPLVHSKSIIDIRGLRQVLSYNGTHIRAQAGAKIGELQKYLSKYDKTLRGIGSITAQTLAGGFSTSLAGIEMCSFSEFATYAKTLDAKGQIVEWNDLYYLRDSMGLMGVLVELEFKVFDNHVFSHKTERRPLENLFDGNYDAFDSVLTFYSDHKNILTVTYEADRTPARIKPVNKQSIFIHELNDYVIAPINFWIPTHSFFGVFESSTEPEFEQLATIAHDAPLNGYIFIDYRIPIEKCIDFFKEMKKQDGFLRIKLLNARKDACLAYTKKSCKVELYVPQHNSVKTYEDLARKFGGYSHWGKFYKGNITKQFETFDCFNDFEKLRQKQDPTDRFKNGYLHGESFVYWYGGNRLWLYHILIPVFFIVQIWTCIDACDYCRKCKYKYKLIN